MPNRPVPTGLDAQDGSWCVGHGSQLVAWKQILLYLVCMKRMVSRVVLEDIFISEFVKEILPSIFLQRLSITASSTLTRSDRQGH